MLTSNEKKLLADVLNGCGMLVEHDPHYLDLMAGDDGALRNATVGTVEGGAQDGATVITGDGFISGLEHNVHDGICLDGLDAKWDVNASNLLHELREMTPAQRRALVTAIGEIWSRNDAHFERDLDALPF